MKVLITGFDPFNEDKINPAIEAVKLLDDKIANASIIKKELPTKYYDSFTLLNEYVQEYNPDFIIMVGQAAKRKGITLEYIAINMYDAKIADNDKVILRHTPIIKDNNEAYVTSLNLSEISSDLSKANIDNYISYHAGSFVCNSTYYQILDKINKENLNTKALFVHVPLIKSQIDNYPKDTYYMELSEVVTSLKIIIESILK